MRELTEQHIRELVRSYRGDSKAAAFWVLQMRLWTIKVPTEPIELHDGGTITFKVLHPNLLSWHARTKILVEYTGVDFTDNVIHFFPYDSLMSNLAEMSLKTIRDAPDFWRAVFETIVYHAKLNNAYWQKAPERFFCDGVETSGVKMLHSSCPVWTDPKRSQISPSNVLGHVRFTGVPAGTQKVSMYYYI